MNLLFHLLASATLSFGAERPWREVRLTPGRPRQGDVVRIVFEGMPKPSNYMAVFAGREFPIHRIDRGRSRALVPTNPNSPTGEGVVRVVQKGMIGKQVWPLKIFVRKGRFKEQHLAIDEETEELFEVAETSAALKSKAVLRRALDTHSPKQLWKRRFIRPTGGRLTGAYGRRRVYNGKPSTRFHRGSDFAGRRGVSVRSINYGKVVYAAQTVLEGLGVVIDHGHGVVSLYIHLDSIFVEVGEEVSPGQKIATIGSTGVATGPHLHFGVYVNELSVNPVSFLKRIL